MFQRMINAIKSLWGNFFSTTVPLFLQGRPLPSRYDLRRFITEAYEGNPLCYAATMEIATSMAEAPLKVRRRATNKDVNDSHPLATLLSRPNDYQSMADLIIETTAQLLTCGDAYWLLDNAGMFPQFIQSLPPYCVEPEYSNGKMFYVFTNYGGKSVTFEAERVLHFRESPDLKDPLVKGMPPVVAIRRFIDIDNVLARYVADFFANNAVPPALLIYKQKLNPGDVQRITEEMKERHATPGKYHSLGVSFGDARIEKLGLSVKDLDVKPVLDFVETRILQAFNIPPVLIGAQAAMGVSASYSNYREARESFQTENIGPRQKRFQEVLNHGLLPWFGDNLEIYFDLSNVMALEESKQKRKEQALAAWNGGALTLNEFRKDWGLEPLIADGDFRKPTNVGGQNTFNADKPQSGVEQTNPPQNSNGKDLSINESEAVTV